MNDQIKIVENYDKKTFETDCNSLLNKGYFIITSVIVKLTGERTGEDVIVYSAMFQKIGGTY